MRKPVLVRAVSETSCPPLYQGPRGLLVMTPAPAGDTAVSSKYWVVKTAVFVVSAAGMVKRLLCAPPALQAAKIARLWPSAAVCGLGTSRLCWEPGLQVKMTGA